MFGRTLLAAALAALAAGPAAANARTFAYTYESAVLPAGRHEVELSTTWRVGRTDVYSRFDQRAEFEFGVTDRLLTALYLNWRKVSAQDPLTRELVSESEFSGLSSEWKFKVLDPAADPVGLAGYLEFSGDTDEAEVEAKLIVDRAFGPLLVAYNAVTEGEWAWAPSAFANAERVVEHDLGITMSVAPGLSLGGEARTHTVYGTGLGSLSAAFAGPVIHAAKGEFWITATCQFQVKGLSTVPAGGRFEFLEHERVNARVLLSLPL